MLAQRLRDVDPRRRRGRCGGRGGRGGRVEARQADRAGEGVGGLVDDHQRQGAVAGALGGINSQLALVRAAGLQPGNAPSLADGREWISSEIEAILLKRF